MIEQEGGSSRGEWRKGGERIRLGKYLGMGLYDPFSFLAAPSHLIAVHADKMHAFQLKEKEKRDKEKKREKRRNIRLRAFTFSPLPRNFWDLEIRSRVEITH